jgi:hypothetical protein
MNESDREVRRRLPELLEKSWYRKREVVIQSDNTPNF